MKKARWAALAAAVVALFVAARLLPVEEWLRAFPSWVARQGPLGGVLYGAVYTAATLFFVPAWILTVGAGLIFGVLWGTVIVSIASTTTAAAAFLIARHLARARVEAFARGNEKFAAIDRAIREKGWRVVALLRLSPLVPFNLSNYLYGLTPVPFGSYVLASWIAMLPGTVLYVSIGSAGQAAALGRERQRSPLEWALIGAGLVATAVVTVMITRAARRELQRMRVAG